MLPCTCSLPSSPSISKFISTNPPLSMLETQCTTMRDLHQLHSQIIKTGLARDPIAASRLLSFCATSPSGDLHYAAALFSHIPNPNPFMYNTLIRALSRSSTPHLALSLFHLMLHSPTHPQPLTFPPLFVACAQLGSTHDGSQLHGMAIKHGYASDPFIRNSMIQMYAASGCAAAASRLFTECQTFDIVAWNTMLLALAKNSLLDNARSLFDEMPERTIVTWSSMISGYVRNGRYNGALDLFDRMLEDGIEPNANTIVSLLSACACLGSLEQGERILTYLAKSETEVNPIVITAVIDMYCKCGSVGDAGKVFERASRKGLSSWNSMISGLAVHGRGEEAVRLFERLRSSGLRPDGVSFVSVLTACNHSGMVEEARYYFAMMNALYYIEPAIEHYGCLVDVLGRAGQLEEAEELIQGMPMNPDSVMWGSLLSACRIHGNVEIGERARMQLVELDPWDSGGYVLASNTYASAGNFGSAVGSRVVMKEKRVQKHPGCSMIEVNGVAHEFVAAGMLHPQAKEIYAVLDELGLKLRGESHVEI